MAANIQARLAMKARLNAIRVADGDTDTDMALTLGTLFAKVVHGVGNTVVATADSVYDTTDTFVTAAYVTHRELLAAKAK